jgi:hypothetical protein
VAGAGERAVEADLIVGEGADQQIALAHVGQATLDAERQSFTSMPSRLASSVILLFCIR